jgi:NAD kinase
MAVVGGTFNPPHIPHVEGVKAVARVFDEVIIFPCGPRPEPEKRSIRDIDPIHRATMIDLAFHHLPVRIILSDMENDKFTRTNEVQMMFEKEGEVWHVVGADLIEGGAEGKSPIQKNWEHGRELWHSLKFAVLRRKNYPLKKEDLPPQSFVVDTPELDGSSSAIREAVFRREHSIYKNMLSPEVADYIERHNLYCGRPSRSGILELKPNLEMRICYDRKNPKAKEIAAKFKTTRDRRWHKAILVIGGDGTMLQAVKKYWRERLPFIGINTGHRGFLLNDFDPAQLENFFQVKEQLVVYELPFLSVSYVAMDGTSGTELCFNDAWVQRESNQAAWLEIIVDGQKRLKRMVADGALVATAAGSTAYARAMGATPLPADTEGLVLVGNNVFEPNNWRFSSLSTSSVIEINSLGAAKRPIRGFADGLPLGGGKGKKLLSMKVRLSRIAAAQLAFLPERDFAEKISRLQFPTT